MRKFVFVLLAVILMAGAAQAQMKTSADVVKAEPAASVVSAAAGQRVAIEIKMDISTKWHIYAHGDSNFIGVDMVPSEMFPLDDFQAEYPHGHEGEFFGDKVFMIEGKDKIQASALVPAGMPAGEYPLEFEITVQACDDKTCLAPAYLPVAVQLQVK